MKNFIFLIFLVFSLEAIQDNPFFGSGLHHSLQLVTGDFVEAEVDIETRSPERLQLKRAFYLCPRQRGELAQGWHFNVPDLGEATIPRVKFMPPEGHQFLYEYDDLKRLTRVELVKDKTVLNFFDISYSSHTCTVVSNEGETVCYGLSNHQLASVQRSDGYFCEYSYAPHPKERKLLLKERREKNGAWTKFTHHASGKIKELFQSHDQGETYKLLCSLDYEEQVTTVVDMLGALTKYHHDGLEKIHRIETYTSDQILYKIQEYEWQGEFLVRRAVKDPEGHTLLEEKWTYDLAGNLIEEVFDGTKKSYSYVCNQLIEEREELGATYRYSYDAKGRQISKVTLDGDQIAFQTFYTYDDEDRLIATTLDDGSFEKTLEFSPQNHPLRQVKGCLDLETEEALFSYDNKGKILQKTLRNLLTGQEEWAAFSYGSDGKIVEITTSQGDITRFFEKEKRHYKNNIETITSYSNEGYLYLEETYKKGKLVDRRRYTHGPAGLIQSCEDQGGNKTEFIYDCFGRVIEELLPAVEGIRGIKRYCYNILDQVEVQIDPLCNVTRISYDARGNPLTIEYPDGSFEEKHYTKNGRLKQETLRNGTSRSYAYDFAGRVVQKDEVAYTYQGCRLVKETHSSNLEINHTYDCQGRLVASEASSGRKATYEYNEKGELSSQKEWISENEWIDVPLPRSEETSEEEDSDLNYIANSFGQFVLEEKIRLPGGITRTLTYNARRQIEKIEVHSPDGDLLDQHVFRYDLNGRKIQERTGKATHEWSYDAVGNVIQDTFGSHLYNNLGQLEKDILPDGREISYGYDLLGRLEKLVSSDNSVAYTLQYDSKGRISKITDEINDLITLREYTLEGQLTKEILGNGLAIQNTYDLLGRRVKLTLPDSSCVHYDYSGSYCSSIRRGDYAYSYLERDKQGRPLKTSMICNLGEITFERAGGRCIGTSSPYFTQTAALDNENRITSLITDGQERFFTYDGLSELIDEEPLNELEYDLNGNLTKKGPLTFTYDALNRLIKVENGGKLLHYYIYDLFHRRILDQGRRFLYDGNWEMGSYAEGNTPKELRIFENPCHLDHGACIAFELSGEVFAPVYDLNGSVAALVSPETKKTAAYYRYTPFGECQADEMNIKNPWRFANKRYDETTGLVFFGRRDYDPASHRFISKDPLGFHDGSDLYAYLHNNPLNAFDIFGLKSISEQWNEALQKGAEVIKSWFSCFFQKIKQTAVNAMNYLLHTVIGAGFLLLFAHYDHGPRSGVYGKGEVSDKVRVTFINGVLTEHQHLDESLKALSESHGDVNIHFIHRQTKGWFSDMLSGILVQLGFISPDAHELAGEWKKLIAEMGGVNGGGKIIHYAHSIGALETLRALSLLTPEEKKMIDIYTFGSPSFANNDPDAKIRHFASIRDGVCLLDIVSFIKAAMGKIENVVFVGSLWGLPFIDHLFASQSYQDLWKSMGRTFVEWYGTV